jgi:hypothetical protein
MNALSRTAAVLAVATAAALPAAAGTATAATTPPTVGSLQVGVVGVPSSVHRGTTIHMVVWYRDNSKFDLLPLMDNLTIWRGNDAKDWGASQGVTVSIQSPQTGRWMAVPRHAWTTDYPEWSGITVKATPGYWEHLNVRVTFGKSALPGNWTVLPNPAYAYGVLNRKGQGFDAYVTRNIVARPIRVV